jgi:hypothetical protein
MMSHLRSYAEPPVDLIASPSVDVMMNIFRSSDKPPVDRMSHL